MSSAFGLSYDQWNILKKDLEILRLDKPIVSKQSKAEELLSRIYKPGKVCKLLGYLQQRKTLTFDQMKEKGYSSSMRSRYEREIVSAGISSLSLDQEVELPALSEILEDNVKNATKSQVILGDHKIRDTERRQKCQRNVVKTKEVYTSARMVAGVPKSQFKDTVLQNTLPPNETVWTGSKKCAIRSMMV